MKHEKWLFIGTDPRLAVCQALMSKEGKTCKLVQTDTFTEEVASVLHHFQPTQIVFPIGQMAQSIPTDLLTAKPTLYVGNVSEQWLAPFQNAHFTIRHYLQEPLFVWENAHLTAEAFVKEFYKETKRSVKNNHFYVAGFGRVGKMVAQLIQGMQGNVTIVARDEEQLAEAKMTRYDTLAIHNKLQVEESYIVNTIPAKWLKNDQDHPLFIFDLASSPGCLVDSQNVEYYKLLPRLPGKHFPIEAALVLKDALNRMNST